MVCTVCKIRLLVSLKLTEVSSTAQGGTEESHLANCLIVIRLSQFLHICSEERAGTSKGMERHHDRLLTVCSFEQVKNCSKLHQIFRHKKEPKELCETLATSAGKHRPVTCPLVADVIQEKFDKCINRHTSPQQHK